MPGSLAPSQARTQGAFGLVSPGATEDAAWRSVIAGQAPVNIAGWPTKPEPPRRSRSTRPRAGARWPSSSPAAGRGSSRAASASSEPGRCSRPAPSRRRAPRRPGGPASCARPGGRGRSTCGPRAGCSSSRRPPARAGLRSGGGSCGTSPLHVLERGLADEERARPDDGRPLELGRRDHQHPRKVAERLDYLLVVLSDNEQNRQVLAPSRKELSGLFGRRLRESRSVEHGKRSPCGVIGEGSAEGRLAGLAIDLDREVRARLERVATARPLRGARGAGPGATGALLAPRLPSAAGDEAAALERAGSGAVGVQLRAHRLVDEVRLDVGAEDRFLEGGVLGLLA